MSSFSPPAQARRGHAIARAIAVAVLLAAAIAGEPGRADPGDFQAMPGLWKIVMRTFVDGHADKPSVQWHCVDEGADPWVEFANMPVPASCKRSGEQRSSTALAWNLACPGAGNGRVDFDSSQHYTASVSLQGREVVQVEGRRYAACTSPSD